MFRSIPRTTAALLTAALSLVLFAGACSSGDDEADTDESPTSTTEASEEDDTASTTSTTTTIDDGTPPTVAADGPEGVLAEGSVTTEDGLTSDWTLTATATSLCFEADLSHPDPAIDESAGPGVSDCLEPDGGLDEMESGLSVDVGSVDGEKTIGFLWGRVAPEVISLTIEHTDGTQTPIDILDGPTDVGVFGYVVAIDSIPPVQDLDAVSGTQIEGSVAIRDFLRAGPTYPVVTPPPTTTAPDYPVS